MKLTAQRTALLKSLTRARSVADRRNTIPILANVLIQAGPERLTLTATDMDLTIVEGVEAEVVNPGETTVPAHAFYDIVHMLPDGAQVGIMVDGNAGQMALTSGRFKSQLTTLPKEDFPAMEEPELPRTFTVSALELRNLIDRTFFAISTEETRYYLNGIYLHAGESVLRAVATDGHRLARFEMPLPAGAEEMPGVIVRRDTVGKLRKMISKSNAEVEVALSDTKIRFSFGSTLLTSKLIDGTFPDYERVIPADNDKVLEVDCRSFASAVSRVSAKKDCPVTLAVADGTMTLSATGAAEEIEINYGGDLIGISFNARYLLDIAKQIKSEMIRIEFVDEHTAAIVREIGNTSTLYVLMPMRL